MLDVAFARSHFPAFSDPSLDGWAFFENAGGSYTCGQVIERLTDFYTRCKVQPYAPYPAAQKDGSMMDESYRRLAEYLNVDLTEVNFGPSTTQNTYVLAKAFREIFSEGDEVIVTNQDHEANSGAWRRMEQVGITVREWSVDRDTGMLDINDLDALINDKTRLLAFPHCSNIVAHVNPVASICAKARDAGVTTVVDGVSYAGHGLPDVDALGADIYLFSLYKTYGPHQGLMVMRKPTLDKLNNQGHFFNADYPQKKLVPAGPDHAQIGAAAGIADYFDLVHAHHFPGSKVNAAKRGVAVHDLLRDHEKELLQPVLDYLDARNNVRVLGPVDAAVRAPTVAVEVQGDAGSIARSLADHKIMCSSGNFYAYRLIDTMGLDPKNGALRLSFVHYTTKNEVDQLLNALDTVL